MRLKEWKASAYNMFQLPSMLRLHKRGLLIAGMENPPPVATSAGNREENTYLKGAGKVFKASGIPGRNRINAHWATAETSSARTGWGGAGLGPGKHLGGRIPNLIGFCFMGGSNNYLLLMMEEAVNELPGLGGVKITGTYLWL